MRAKAPIIKYRSAARRTRRGDVRKILVFFRESVENKPCQPADNDTGHHRNHPLQQAKVVDAPEPRFINLGRYGDEDRDGHQPAKNGETETSDR